MQYFHDNRPYFLLLLLFVCLCIKCDSHNTFLVKLLVNFLKVLIK